MSDNCIFCKIAAGAIPCAKVHEDESCVAFMDIGPLAEGHVLLIPKKHAETLDQLDSRTAGEMLSNLPAIVGAVKRATGCSGVNVLQNNGKSAHQEVPHVHFHIIPRNHGDAFGFNWPAGKYASGRMEEILEKIKSLLKG